MNLQTLLTLDLAVVISVAIATTIFNKAFFEPIAQKLGKEAYSHLRPYLQETFDKLDSSLADKFQFIDEAILPPELSYEDQQVLLGLVLKEFSLATHLAKTANKRQPKL